MKRERERVNDEWCDEREGKKKTQTHRGEKAQQTIEWRMRAGNGKSTLSLPCQYFAVCAHALFISKVYITDK